MSSPRRAERARRILHYYGSHSVDSSRPMLRRFAFPEYVEARGTTWDEFVDFKDETIAMLGFSPVPAVLVFLWDIADRSGLSVENVLELLSAFEIQNSLLDMRVNFTDSVLLLHTGILRGYTIPQTVTLAVEAFTGFIAHRPIPETDPRLLDRARWTNDYLSLAIARQGDWRSILREGTFVSRLP